MARKQSEKQTARDKTFDKVGTLYRSTEASYTIDTKKVAKVLGLDADFLLIRWDIECRKKRVTLHFSRNSEHTKKGERTIKVIENLEIPISFKRVKKLLGIPADEMLSDSMLDETQAEVMTQLEEYEHIKI